MIGFRPTVAAPGRLLRLGLVLDTRDPAERIREISRMCEGAGIEALWTRDDLAAELRRDAWNAIVLAAGETRTPAVGAAVSIARRPPETLAAMAGALDASCGGRLELTFSRPEGETADALERYVRHVRGLLERAAIGVSSHHVAGGSQDELDVSVVRMSVEVTDLPSAAVAARVGDDAVVVAAPGHDVDRSIRHVRLACEELDRPLHTIGIALELPVSIGRTTAEAHVRAESERLFDTLGQPADVGVFGTLEQCQERVIGFAHAGVSDLRCVVPGNPDIHDVIAQLTAIAVGTVNVLTPDAPRSKAPDPPEGWGGRAAPSSEAGSNEGSG